MSSMSENRSALREFLASIATIRGDLSNITAPPFVLADKSAVEFPQYWAEQPAIFTAPAAEPNPQKRALLVLKWFLSSLKSQQYAGRSESDGIKKPLNAFLGELFIGHWEDGNGTTRLIVEQVSHHPPVTATILWNDECGIRAEGYTRQEITFNGSVNIKQVGHAILHIDKYDEDYLIPLPNIKVKGILSGTPYPELNGHYQIVSSNGFHSEINFSGRGIFSGGTKNSFEAKLYRDDDAEKLLYTVSGQWVNSFTIHDLDAGEDVETYNASVRNPQPIVIAELEDQDLWESRRAWGGVINALHRGNMQSVSDEKGKIERAQRRMRKEEQKAGTQWQQAFFKTVEKDVVFEDLAAKAGQSLEVGRTVGIWKFDPNALDRPKPYHGELTPTGPLAAGAESWTDSSEPNTPLSGRSRQGSRVEEGVSRRVSTQGDRLKEKCVEDEKDKQAIEEMLRDQYATAKRRK